MTTITLLASSLTAANPYVIGSAPDNLTGYSVPGAANQAKIYGVPKVWSMASGTNATWRCDTQLTGNVISSKIKLPSPVSSNAVCAALLDGSHNGILVITGTGTNNFRLFAVANGVLTGSQLRTPDAVAPIAGATVELRRTINGASHDYEIFQSGSKIGATYTNNTYNATYGACMSRGGDIAEFSVEYTPAYEINTFTDPLVPSAAASGTQTGFSNGAITADFGGLTFTGTVSGSAISGTMSSFVDGGLCPLLPAASVSGTFTQGGNTANLTRAISVPTGLQELRDGGGTPANFSGIVLGDPKYIGQSFADAGNPLTTLDRSYVDPSYGLTIDQDGRVRLNAPDHPTDPVPSLPYTTTLWIRRGADGKAYSHTLTIDEEGNVSTGGLSVAGLSNSGLSNAGLSVSGL